MVKQRHPYKHQILATIIVCILAESGGAAMSWLSPALIYLKSDPSRFGHTLTVSEISNIGAAYSYGSLFLGGFITVILVHYFGRKIVLNLLGLPILLFWTLVKFGPTVEYLYVARAFSGFASSALFMTCPVFIIEFANPKIRPNLACCVSLFLQTGGFFGMLANNNVHYDNQPYIFFGFPLLYMIFFKFFPDTPQQLLKQHKYEKARESLRFYQNYEKDSPELEKEFNELRQRIDDLDKEKITWSELCSKKFQKSLFLSICLIVFNQTTGNFILFNYIGLVYNELEISTELGSILFAFHNMIASLLAGFFSNRFEKKKIMTCASIIGLIGSSTVAVLSLFLSRSETLRDNNWVFIVIISVTYFTLQFGVHSLTHVAINELYNIKTKEYGIGITYIFGSIVSLIFLKLFPIILIEYGIFPAMIIIIIPAFLSTLFYGLLLPETGHVLI